ncbi:MAG: UDP-N-acetylmuramate dehydrogenase [Candidatus Magasanikbacteria bacterium]|nr:UDP-N-acetylmuramate dehydrogenase [Candidatus Magasanikbacteria bacterium]
MEQLYKELKNFGKVRPNASLAKFSNFNIGGPADFLIETTKTDTLIGLLNFLSGEGIEYLVLGGGSNVLFPDEGFRGAVIKISNIKYQISNLTIDAEAGMDLSKLVELSIQNKFTGLEWAAGIPGSVGGAIRGNAGAHYAFTGGEMKDTLETVSVWRDGEVVELFRGECEFGYRDSVFKHNTDVVLSGRFQLVIGGAKKSLEMTQKIVAERQAKQDHHSSAGSFFKNIMLEKWPGDVAKLPERFLNYKKIAAGWVIEQVGLKGYRVGGAMVSPNHGNFIINLGGATQADVLGVVEKVTIEVYNRYGVELESEVQIVR